MTRASLTALAFALSLSACANDPAPAPAPDTVAVEDDELYEGEEGDEEDGEEAEPPAAVAEAFAAAYPAATEVKWSMEGADYEAEAMIDGVETSILYTAAGVAGAIETEIAVADLPAAVTAALARDYAGQTVTEAARIVENGETTYEAEITVDGVPTDLLFLEDGTRAEAAMETDDE